MSLVIRNYKPLTVPKSIRFRKIYKMGNEKMEALFELIINDEVVYVDTRDDSKPIPTRLTQRAYDNIEEEFLAQDKPYPYIIQNFIYNGFSGQLKSGFTKYRAEFINWTGDPGVARMLCSDGKVRLIPTFALKGRGHSLPKDTTRKEERIIFGRPSKS